MVPHTCKSLHGCQGCQHETVQDMIIGQHNIAAKLIVRLKLKSKGDFGGLPYSDDTSGRYKRMAEKDLAKLTEMKIWACRSWKGSLKGKHEYYHYKCMHAEMHEELCPDWSARESCSSTVPFLKVAPLPNSMEVFPLPTHASPGSTEEIPFYVTEANAAWTLSKNCLLREMHAVRLSAVWTGGSGFEPGTLSWSVSIETLASYSE